jgi:hypothetical protein
MGASSKEMGLHFKQTHTLAMGCSELHAEAETYPTCLVKVGGGNWESMRNTSTILVQDCDRNGKNMMKSCRIFARK